jgi:type VI secretion system protein VasD
MRIFTFVIFLITLLLSGCGSEPKKEEPKPPPPETKIQINITVSSVVNPDINDRPSPIVVRLYELKNIGKFEEADFYKLFEDHEGALGSDLLASEKFHFKPGETKTFGHAVSPDTKYIAVTSAFRDFNQSVWRDSITIEANKTSELEIVLERLNVSIKKKEPK